MNVTELRDRVKIENACVRVGFGALSDDAFRSLVLDSGLFPANQLEITEAHPADDDTRLADDSDSGNLTIIGKAWCPIANEPTDVLALFALHSGVLTVTLRYRLSSSLSFSRTFTDLPFKIVDPYFYVSTRPHLHKDDRINLALRAGVNFVAGWNPDPVLQLLTDLGMLSASPASKGQELTGYVVPINAKDNGEISKPIPPVPFDKFPWDVSPSLSGTYLRAELGGEIGFPST